jgi:hypothetical protein
MEYELLDRSEFVQAARSGYDRSGEGLQEKTAQSPATCASNGVTKGSEAMFFRGSCGGVPAESSCHDLNQDICEGPRHGQVEPPTIHAMLHQV